jgi:RimJ/RimL family protein N-acetyltransferase
MREIAVEEGGLGEHRDRRGAVPLGPVTLAGRLVRLEPLAAAHLDGLLAAALETPAEVFALTTVRRERAAMAAWLDEAVALGRAGRAVPFATVEAASGRVVGSTRFSNVERWSWPDGRERRPPGGADAVEIGWTWLSARAQRTGVNTEAKLLMLRHAFTAWRVHRVQLKTDERNQRSRSAIDRLGARFEGVLRCQLPSAEGGVRDTAFFSVVEAEWPAVEARLEGLLRRHRGGA